MRVWLGLGSNLEQPVAQLNTALTMLNSTQGIEILQTSGFYRTPPWGDAQQDDFINAVVQINTCLAAMPLLHVLQSIENRMGRQRSERRWGPRCIDIDMLLYGELVSKSEELDLPHARMHERAFVLMPLCELDETLVIPGRGTVAELLKNLDCSGISRLSDGE
jgi:2-amino-4-hydroxy-6-hydroxymethyldihydropteridine diphosphokinase